VNQGVRRMRRAVRSVPPKSWRDLGTHYIRVLEEPWYRTVVALQDAITELTVGFWSGRGLRTLHLPITTGSISSPMGLGSDSLPVKVEMFGVETYLADSMQFALEYGCRLSPEGCYYVMPSFRGEAVDETHLAQFFHSEAEIPGGLDDVMAAVEDYLGHLCRGLLDRLPDELLAAAGGLSHVEGLASGDTRFERLIFDEAVGLLGDDPRFVEVGEGGWRDINRAGERRLMAEVGEFLWLTHWDHMTVPFYQAFADGGRRLARNADLLFGVGETVGAGERHETAGDVLEACRMHGVDPKAYEWYREMRERFPMRTSGFGMGIERFMLWVLRHDDVRDLQLLPRVNGVTVVP